MLSQSFFWQKKLTTLSQWRKYSTACNDRGSRLIQYLFTLHEVRAPLGPWFPFRPPTYPSARDSSGSSARVWRFLHPVPNGILCASVDACCCSLQASDGLNLGGEPQHPAERSKGGRRVKRWLAERQRGCAQHRTGTLRAYIRSNLRPSRRRISTAALNRSAEGACGARHQIPPTPVAAHDPALQLDPTGVTQQDASEGYFPITTSQDTMACNPSMKMV